VAVAARGGRCGAAAVPILAAGVVESFKSLQRRILAMTSTTNRSQWSRGRWAVTGALLALAALVALPPWRVVAQDKPGAAAPAPGAKGAYPGGDTANNPFDRGERGERRGGERGGPRAAAPEQYVGHLTADRVRLQPGVDGIIEKVSVKSGDRARKGQVVIALDGARARAMLAQAEAKAQLAQAQMSRVKDLARQATISQQEVEQSVANLDIAHAELMARKQDLEETIVRAPFDGVAQITAREGQRVTRGEPLGELVEVDALRVEFSVPEVRVAGLKIGQPVSVRVGAYPDRAYDGQISNIAPVVDAGTGTIRVDARLTGKIEGLRPGMSARVSPAAAQPDGAAIPSGAPGAAGVDPAAVPARSRSQVD
jgi:RND family efflux transporter MFP subunit